MQSYSQNTNLAGLLLNITKANTVQLLSGKNTGTTNNVDYYNVVTTGTVTDGAWHHVVGTYDGAKLHIYIDGAEDGTGTAWTNAAAFAATNYVRVGCGNASGTNGSYFQGCLDEVAFFPSDALSLAQVQSLYAASITDSSNSAIKALASAIYLFEDGAQLTDSSTGGTHTLTAIGKPTTCTPKFGGSVYLGNGSRYSFVDNADLHATTSFTFTGWIKTNNATITSDGYIFFIGSNPPVGGIWIYVQRNTYTLRLYIGNNDTASSYSDGTTNINDGQWHFISITWAKPYYKIYVDGQLEKTSAAWNYDIAYAATTYCRVGARSFAGSDSMLFDGQLEQLNYYVGRTLTADEILTEYNNSLSGFYSVGIEEQSEIKYYRVMAIQGIYSLGEFLQYLTVREITTKEADSWAVVGTSTVDDVDEVVGF
jgi:large repetitive protein